EREDMSLLFIIMGSVLLLFIIKDIEKYETLLHAIYTIFLVATMGDLLGARILYKDWKIPVGVFYRAIVWGIIGVVTTYGMS
ncbi:hypothetical protein D1N68_20795, partial [Clostridioides difficile]